MGYFDQIAPQLAAAAFNPLFATPRLPEALPKSNSNFGGAAVTPTWNPGPVNMLNALTNMQNVAGENQLRTQQASGAAIQNVQSLDQMNFVRRSLGLSPMTPDDLKSGKYQDVSGVLGGGASAAAPAAGGPQQPQGNAASASPSAQKTAGTDPLDPYADRVISLESGGDPNAKNPRSSATGPGQFVDKTWLSVARDHFPETAQMDDSALLARRTDPDFSRSMVKAYAQDNAQALTGAGVPVTAGNLYAAHFLGAGGAAKVLSADPGAQLSDLLPAAVIKANPNLDGMTAGRFAANMALKMSGSAAPPRWQLVQAGSGTASDSGASGAAAPAGGAAGMPDMGQAMQSAMVKRYLGYPLTPFDSMLIGASMYPAGSPQRRLAEQALYHSVGINPTLELRQGGSGWMLNPDTGQYELKAQSPKLPEGAMLQAGPNGQLSAQTVPGALPAIGAAAAAAAGGKATMEPEPVLGPDGRTYVIPRATALTSPTPLATGLSPQERSQGEAAGKAAVEYGDLLRPNPATPPSPPQAMAPGAPPNGGVAVPGSPAPSGGTGNPAANWQQPAQNAGTPTPRGTVLPPLGEQGPVPNTPAELDKAIPAWQKKQEEWNSAIAPARQAELRLGTIANAFKMVESGTWQTDKAAFDGALKSLGLPTVFTDPGAVETALHENYLQTMQRLKAATSRFTQQEFRITSENSEHPDLQPGANLTMLSEDLAILRQAQQLPADWTQAQNLGWKNPLSFESAWNARNPLDRAVAQARQEIGPLKGMPGAVSEQPRASATGPNGHKLIFLGDQWIDAVTHQPLPPLPPLGAR